MPPRLRALRLANSAFYLRTSPTATRLLVPFALPVQQRSASILASLSDTPGAYHKKIRRGRGPASGKGKTAGRGQKGQHAHGKVPAGFQGGQTPLSITKRERGNGKYNPFKVEMSPVNLDTIQSWIDQGRLDPSATITMRELSKSRCIHGVKRHGVKLLGRNADALKSAINIVVSRASASAIARIEALGGSVTTRFYSPTSIKQVMGGIAHPTISWQADEQLISLSDREDAKLKRLYADFYKARKTLERQHQKLTPEAKAGYAKRLEAAKDEARVGVVDQYIQRALNESGYSSEDPDQLAAEDYKEYTEKFNEREVIEKQIQKQIEEGDYSELSNILLDTEISEVEADIRERMEKGEIEELNDDEIAEMVDEKRAELWQALVNTMEEEVEKRAVTALEVERTTFAAKLENLTLREDIDPQAVAPRTLYERTKASLPAGTAPEDATKEALKAVMQRLSIAYPKTLADASSRKDIEYYRDPAHRGYLAYTVKEGESPSLFFKPPGEVKDKKKQAARRQAAKASAENRLF